MHIIMRKNMELTLKHVIHISNSTTVILIQITHDHKIDKVDLILVKNYFVKNIVLSIIELKMIQQKENYNFYNK